ncbi:unnamed protein product [Moneuplotes crassus]|uniref:Uncharacterized protein n=1 Tax=Euplotes crassus TaxID=5936 RepID=A0AAD2D465_EUPCR|nr:unnamed protein product [Moneuplotes crassus]
MMLQSSNSLFPKLLFSAVGMTSIAYLKYISMVNAKARRNPLTQILSKIPKDIKDLGEFTQFEIIAITKRNTIKNKSVGKQRIGLPSKLSQRDTEASTSHLEEDLEGSLRRSSSEKIPSINYKEPNARSKHSNSELTSRSCNSCLYKLKSILKSSCADKIQTPRYVQFDL